MTAGYQSFTTKASYILTCFCLLFFNYYNPGSVYVTFLLNITIFSFYLFAKKYNQFSLDIPLLTLTFIVFLWANLLFIFYSSDDYYVLGKYWRVFLSTILLMFIFSHVRVDSRNFAKIVSVIFIMHIVSVAMQYIFPQISPPMASLFGMGDSQYFFDQYRMRKMGLTSSFDTASLISISSMIYFFMYYYLTKNKFILCLIFLSFMACLASSRMGMILGIVCFLLFSVFLLLKSKKRIELIYLILFTVSMPFYIHFVYPILLHSFGFHASSVFTPEYGATGISGLTGLHLDPFRNASFFQILFGLAYDPEGSDVGYLKLLYHVGSIGTILIIFLYLYMMVRVYNFKFPDDPYAYMLQRFFVALLAVVFVVNYKSLEIFSRGTHDFVLIMYFYLANIRFRASVSKHSQQHFTIGQSYEDLFHCNKL